MRPVVVVEETFAHSVDAFHHQVLRPVLKLQHPLLIRAFAEWGVEHKQQLDQKKPEQGMTLIEHAMKTHKRLRATVIGMMIGMLTQSEYERYLKHKRESNRRIVMMATKRLQDSYQEILDYTLVGPVD